MLFARLESVRQQGFALNKGLSEQGVTALGRAIRDAEGVVIAGLAIAMPDSRFEPTMVRPMVAGLQKATRAIEAALEA